MSASILLNITTRTCPAIFIHNAFLLELSAIERCLLNYCQQFIRYLSKHNQNADTIVVPIISYMDICSLNSQKVIVLLSDAKTQNIR